MALRDAAPGGRGVAGAGEVRRQIRRLVLASASPRREMLLRQIGLTFEVCPTNVEDGFVAASPDPEAQALELAEAKARAAASTLDGDRRGHALVLGADTVVLVSGRVLGKPADAAGAAAMLRMLSGQVHTVLTAVALLDTESGRVVHGVERTRVKMSEISPEDIGRYVVTGEPMDKAGAYAVQGLGSLFIERVEGCYANVVGLPISLVGRMFESVGFRVADTWQTAAIKRAGGEGDDHRPEDQGSTG